MRKFNHEMLAIARDANGFTQEELASKLGGSISQSKLSKIENGLLEPSNADISVLAKALGFRESFFFHSYVRRSVPPTYHRKRKKLSVKEWSRLYAVAELYRVTAALLLRSVELSPTRACPPTADVDAFDGKIENIAVSLRQFWRLPRGPIDDVTSLIEGAGIMVVAFDFGTSLCDGFGQHADETLPAMIFVNTRQPKDRFRFTLCHELGHIIMHAFPTPSMEDEANRFAAEFLMPTADISKDFYNMSMEKLMSLKLHWRTSMHSIVYKAKSCGRMTENTYNYYMISMSKKGWRTQEPVELKNVREAPRIMRQLVQSHTGPLQYSADDLSSLTGLRSEMLNDMHGLESKPKLRLVVDRRA
jgi:Zn-dependent peptidase ImmA (M78 family)/transcriptional regulator with XRE-family HTH domain